MNILLISIFFCIDTGLGSRIARGADYGEYDICAYDFNRCNSELSHESNSSLMDESYSTSVDSASG